MKKIEYLSAGALVAILASFSNTANAQVVVVTSAKSSIPALTADQVASLYLGKTDKLPGGGAVALIDQPESSSTRDRFYSVVAGRSPAQVKAAWARLVFSGKARPPKEVATAGDVKKTLAGNPDAIGYIEKSEVDSSVRVLLASE